MQFIAMPTTTAPKKIKKNNPSVIIPRKEYEEFLDWQKKIKSVKIFKPTAAEKKAVQKARKNLAEGKYLTIYQLRHELGIKD